MGVTAWGGVSLKAGPSWCKQGSKDRSHREAKEKVSDGGA